MNVVQAQRILLDVSKATPVEVMEARYVSQNFNTAMLKKHTVKSIKYLKAVTVEKFEKQINVTNCIEKLPQKTNFLENIINLCRKKVH